MRIAHSAPCNASAATPACDPQSAIEETLQRIERASNVTGFVILDNAGNVLRYRTDMGEENARLLATCFKPLLERSLSAVRDLDPTVRSRTHRALPPLATARNLPFRPPPPAVADVGSYDSARFAPR